MNASILKVGDTVSWRGGWGSEPPRKAKIVAMELTEQPRTKHGLDVNSAYWSDRQRLLVTLDNGHWAYGEQIEPIR